MYLLEGKNFLASTQRSSLTWLEQYIPVEEQSRVMAAIAEAIHTKTTFELEHRVIQLNGTVGWTFSRAVPLLNTQQDIVEWLGTASDVTARKQAELNAEFLATATQSLSEATCVEEVMQAIGEQLNHYFQIPSFALIEVSEDPDQASIECSWHRADVPSLVGTYDLSEWVTDEFFQTFKLGQAVVVQDI